MSKQLFAIQLKHDSKKDNKLPLNYNSLVL